MENPQQRVELSGAGLILLHQVTGAWSGRITARNEQTLQTLDNSANNALFDLTQERVLSPYHYATRGVIRVLRGRL